jgi:hypothetical protein
MSAEIIKLVPNKIGDGASLAPDSVLNGAAGSLKSVVVIGQDHAGKLYFAASEGAPWTLWLIEKAKAELLS